MTEKSGRIQKIISTIYDRVKKERVPDDIDNEELKIHDESPHGVSLVSLLPAFDFASLKVRKFELCSPFNHVAFILSVHLVDKCTKIAI